MAKYRRTKIYRIVRKCFHQTMKQDLNPPELLPWTLFSRMLSSGVPGHGTQRGHIFQIDFPVDKRLHSPCDVYTLINLNPMIIPKACLYFTVLERRHLAYKVI